MIGNGSRITAIIPQMLVTDLDRAIAYYRDRLGFSVDFVYESFYASISRDGFAIHLKHSDTPPAVPEDRSDDDRLDAYIAVSGARHLFDELQRRGAQVVKPPRERPWGCIDFYVEDPDRHLLCFSELIG